MSIQFIVILVFSCSFYVIVTAKIEKKRRRERDQLYSEYEQALRSFQEALYQRLQQEITGREFQAVFEKLEKAERAISPRANPFDVRNELDASMKKTEEIVGKLEYLQSRFEKELSLEVHSHSIDVYLENLDTILSHVNSSLKSGLAYSKQLEFEEIKKDAEMLIREYLSLKKRTYRTW